MSSIFKTFVSLKIQQLLIKKIEKQVFNNLPMDSIYIITARSAHFEQNKILLKLQLITWILTRLLRTQFLSYANWFKPKRGEKVE